MVKLKALTPAHFTDYELIDCGQFQKLERFGSHITIRPEPQAVWDTTLPFTEWEKMAHVQFIPKTSSSGDWKMLKQMPRQWTVQYPLCGTRKTITMRLGLTAFKHVGIFPEQAVNWDYIYQTILQMKKPVKFLNLFAYTGGASLAARAAGAETYHLDSIKQVVTWARENMELSGLDNIRWIVEDALKFVKREERRGSKYHGIILDPPAYGHGPSGEKWKLEDSINEMMKHVLNILDENQHFLILNAYSLGFSPIILQNLLMLKSAPANIEAGELYIADRFQKKLPLGAFARFRNT
ncbi:MAG: class I SAM-dependent methyltransferase [Chitinophagales bacterium]|nr:class I SAM-dependent methyltransferase [Chitinophagales bacterium]MDW8418170.1 class I SAM-dependent methyltransferase [Chitinophagales bacterium]